MNVISLNGSSLTIEQIQQVAVGRARVEISEEAMEALTRSRALVFELAESNVPVYGFNTGVGWNKDKRVFKEFFQQYNNNLILSHSLGYGEVLKDEEVRAIMVCRLNPLLQGVTGIQPEIAMMYRDFLNEGISPIIPEKGSVGMGDITNLSHVGLAMIGEGEVFYRGERITAAEALASAGLKPVVLGPKDGLAIVSSNAYAAGLGAMAISEMKKLLDLADLVYAVSLEGLNGNTSPLLKEVHQLRPYQGQNYSAGRIREYLEDSYIWDPDWKKPVQDPLCFRDMAQVHGAVRDALKYLEDLMLVQVNSSDDNPCIILEEKKMISCANFDVTNWAMGFEMLGLGVAKIANAACFRCIKMGDPDFTKLPRFLAPADNVLGFATLQKVYTSTFSEIRHLANPAMLDYFALAGDIEDQANNTPYVVQKTRKMVDLLYRILGIEMIHGAQAIDLRNDIRLGKGSRAAYEAFRKEVEFYKVDRGVYQDIEKAYQALKSGRILQAAELAVGR